MRELARILYHITRMLDAARCQIGGTPARKSEIITLLYDAEAKIYEAIRLMGFDVDRYRNHS